MTALTASEIKILRVQITWAIIVAFFWGLYSLNPAQVAYNVPTSTPTNGTTASSSGSFITQLTDTILPAGMGELGLVTGIIILPFIPTDAMIAIRFARDLLGFN